MVFVVLTVYKNSLGFTGRLQDGRGVVKKKRCLLFLFVVNRYKTMVKKDLELTNSER